MRKQFVHAETNDNKIEQQQAATSITAIPIASLNPRKKIALKSNQ